MADKRQVKQTIKQLQRIKTWQLLVVLMLLVFVSATFLRLDNIGMSDRRQAVLAADKAGDSVAVTSRVYDLQRFVSQHMNTNTGPFYLEGQYKRDAQKAVDAASNDNNPNGNVNVKAEAVCKPQYTVWSPAYVQCFADQLAKYPPSPDPTQNVTLPSTELYRYNFASPTWTADFAGWSTLACLVIVIMIVARLVSLATLRLLLKWHYRGI
ncbi:MAG: hypothetical protein ACHQTE_02030 [Candidatus Saccharimonadales bacterium]